MDVADTREISVGYSFDGEALTSQTLNRDVASVPRQKS
jgi:hypothetical protein